MNEHERVALRGDRGGDRTPRGDRQPRGAGRALPCDACGVEAGPGLVGVKGQPRGAGGGVRGDKDRRRGRRGAPGAPTIAGVPHVTPEFGDHAASTRVVESRTARQAAQTVSPRPAAPTKLPRHASVSSGQRSGASGARMAGTPSTNAIVAPDATTAGTRRSGSQANGDAGGFAHASASMAPQAALRSANRWVARVGRGIRRAF